MATASDQALAGDPPAPPKRHPWLLLWALAAGQLVSWGSLYYSFSLFVVPMERDLGWSKTDLNGALSLGFLVAGFCALPVGAWIDRQGGRAAMTLGSIAGGLLLLCWSQVDSLIAFYAIWMLLGLVLAAVLYEPAFAVITAEFGADYRRGITYLTLVGGFASTVFIPLTQFLIEAIGWRDALLALAACNLLFCAAVHGFMVPGRRRRAAASGRTAQPASVPPASLPAAGRSPLRKAMRHGTFWGLFVCFAAYSATFSAITFHIIPLLTERGVDSTTIVASIAIIGPAQVAGRLVLLAFGPRLTTRQTGSFVVLAFPASVLMLLLLPPSPLWLAAFAMLYGAANGIMTIVRGTAVPELMTREGYATINGALTFPAMIAKALAPVAAAVIWALAGGYDTVLWTIFAGACLAAAGFWFAASRPAAHAAG